MATSQSNDMSPLKKTIYLVGIALLTVAVGCLSSLVWLI